MRPMRGRFAPWLASLLLLAVVLPISALGNPIQEADLDPEGGAYEINRDTVGNLFLSDYFGGDVWQVKPATSAYRVYEDVAAQVEDARPDGAGRIWWTDNYATIGRIDPSLADPSVASVTSWELPGVEALYGLAVDDSGAVWLPEWNGPESRLFRLDPAIGELCTYSWEGGVSSYYALVQGGQVWSGNWENNRIQRLDLAGDEVTYWQMRAGGELVDIEPVGLALDGEQQLWWSDALAGALARLEPEAGRLTLFTLPVGSSPQMIAPVAGRIAYAENEQGTVGLLDPSLAVGAPAEVVSGTLPVGVDCAPLEPAGTAEASVRSGALAWTGSAATLLQAENGWRIYQLPAKATPYGLAESQEMLWATDPGRQKLVRVSLTTKWALYLPLVTRAVGP